MTPQTVPMAAPAGGLGPSSSLPSPLCSIHDFEANPRYTLVICVSLGISQRK